jgi:hypothetical protein
VPGTAVNRGGFTSTSVLSDVVADGITGSSIPVVAGTCLLFLGTATAVGAQVSQTISGKFSGSIVLQ